MCGSGSARTSSAIGEYLLTGLDFTVDNFLKFTCEPDSDAALVGKSAWASRKAAPALTPLSDVSSLWAWFESDSYSQSDGSNITTNWTDQSGNGRHATVNGTPTYETNELNGLPIVRIGADSNDYFQFPDMSAFTEGAMIALLKVTTETSAGDLFGTAGSASLYPFSSDHLIYDGFGSNTRKDSLTPISSLSSWHIVYKYSKASDWAIYQNGSLIYHTGTNTVAFSSFPRIGNNGGAYEKTDRAAVYLFNSKPSDDHVRAVMRHIGSKYDIAV